MEKRIKQCVGIDCAKDELVVSYGVMDEGFDIHVLSNTSFKNTRTGFNKLVAWSKKLDGKTGKAKFVMEATGVYHEQVAKYLYEHGDMVSVVLPNKARAFYKTMSVKTVTDKVSAQVLAHMGLEKKLDAWRAPDEIFNTLRQLTRERDQLITERTQVKNQLHAEKSGAWPNQQSIRRAQSRIAFISKQILQVEDEVRNTIAKNPQIKERIEKVCTIKGVGLITAATVIAETHGFNLIRSSKQLVSYAGLDVIVKDSGTSVRSKPRISKRGNKYLRKCLHFPALAAIRADQVMKTRFHRMVSTHGIKMKAAVAAQRKLLVLIYTLWKKNEVFDIKYSIKKEEFASANPYELA